MFEKDAEEYADGKGHEHYNYLFEKHAGSPADFARLCFQDGAEFGYNKCKEELNQKGLVLQSDMDKTIEQNIALKKELNKVKEWHYMEDELPPKKVLLNIITFDKNKKRRVWVGEYDGGSGQWWTGHFNHFIDVPYAWREIVLPETPKEDKK